jgi:digeranylgeranylglycerophospholipid reductase
MTIECDVLVIGAGPAGSSAAWAAAKGGARTIFIDKKKEVGVPVQCAEGIGRYLIPHLPFKIPKELLKLKIEGIRFWADELTLERTGGWWSGFSINRKEFDKWLALRAVKGGGELLLETELIDLEVDEKYQVTSALIKTPKEEITLKPKVIIAADGVDSTVLKLMGFEIDFDKTGYVYSFELDNINLKKPKFDHIFFGDFAPGGYGYIFPLPKNRANVGIAVLFKKDKVEDFYGEFLEMLIAKGFLNRPGELREEKNGVVPFLTQTNNCLYGNVLLAGDSANHNIKPLVEGFLPSIITGDLAGRVALDFVLKGVRLESYPKALKESCREFFEYSDVLAKTLFETGKNVEKKYHLIRMGIAIDLFSLDQLEYLDKMEYIKVKKLLL